MRERVGYARWMTFALLGVAVLASAGCESVAYYAQAVSGQMRLLNAREPIDEVLEADPESDLAEALRRVQAVLEFAEQHIGMTPGKAYSSFVQLDAPHVVYNVFAAEPLSVSGFQWCYPMVGCAPYRGFFAAEDAQASAAELAAQGLETFVGGVPAYSTLGWFDDPVLSSFVHWPEAELVRLLIHELAHRELFISGDASFNEAFAGFVGDEGMRQWYEVNHRLDEYARWQERLGQSRLWRALVLRLRNVLAEVYAEQSPAEERLVAKRRVMADFEVCYTEMRDQLGGGRFDRAVARVNNAYLSSVATYEDLRPAFRALFEEVQGDWPRFFEAAASLADLDPSARSERLANLAGQPLAEQQVAGRRDEQHPDQVQCKALTGHDLGGKPAG